MSSAWVVAALAVWSLNGQPYVAGWVDHIVIHDGKAKCEKFLKGKEVEFIDNLRGVLNKPHKLVDGETADVLQVRCMSEDTLITLNAVLNDGFKGDKHDLLPKSN